jgi:hypothetical protein
MEDLKSAVGALGGVLPDQGEGTEAPAAASARTAAGAVAQSDRNLCLSANAGLLDLA